MEWTADVSAGDWLRDLIDADEAGAFGATMHSVVPRGFPAYARVLHPPQVSWVDGRAYPTQDELRETDPTRWPQMYQADTSWAEAAAVFGTRVHGLAQWNRIVRAGATSDSENHDWHQVVGPDGREYSSPQEGSIRPDLLTAIAVHLAAHTTTPEAGRVAVWSGWGGLVGFYGEGSSRAVLMPSAVPQPGGDPDAALFERQLQERHRAMLERSTSDPFNNVFRKPTWQPGVLPDEVSRGEKLELPAREHVLFRGGASVFAEPEWSTRVPWANAASPEFTESPSIMWPEDRAWVLVTEVDYDSTIVAGSADLIRALCADGRLEAFEIHEGADLSWDADEVNR